MRMSPSFATINDPGGAGAGPPLAAGGKRGGNGIVELLVCRPRGNGLRTGPT